MRRQFKGRSESFVRSNDGEQGFWPSYADMMSAVALILFFVMLLSYIQNLITGNNLQNTKAALADTEQQLVTTRSALEDTQEELTATRLELSDTQEALSLTTQAVEDAQARLEKITIDLDEAKATLEQQKKEMAGQEKLLADQKALIAQQEEYMKAASAELMAMRSQMQAIAVLRLSILERIQESMSRAMGDSSKVSIGDNGNIILNESILFDVGSSEIKDEAKPALDLMIDVFVAVLSDENNSKYIDTIVISGHTDSTGTDESNRILSTDRANAVLNYLLSGRGGKLAPYARYFCAAGYGETRPVASNNTAEGRTSNRRIEISIILRDDSVMEIVESYLDIEPPKMPGT